MSSEQRLLSEAWEHLRTTKKLSVTKHNNHCTYAGSGCAFSPAILPGCRTDPSLGYKNAGEIILRYKGLLFPWAVGLDLGVANEVQACHDDCENTEGEPFLRELAENLRDVACRNGLTLPDTMLPYLEDKT